MKRILFALVLPVVAFSVLVAQTSRKKSNPEFTAPLPEPNSMTAYYPYHFEGRAYWEREYLYFVDPYVPRVDLYDKDKNLASVRINVPGINPDTFVSDATIAPDGGLIVSGGATFEGGKRLYFVGLANRDGQVSPLIDTGKYTTELVSTCDGKTVWTMGWLRSGPNLDIESEEPYPILREYRLSDGKMIASALDRTTFPRWSHPQGLGSFPDVRMQCRGNTLGIYEGATDEWIEYDLGTRDLRRWKLPEVGHSWAGYNSQGKSLVLHLPTENTYITGVAMLDSGEVYASFFRRFRDGSGPAGAGLFRMEKDGDQAHWIAVAGTLGQDLKSGTFHELCGTDGKNLVYSRFDEYHWFFSAPPRQDLSHR